MKNNTNIAMDLRIEGLNESLQLQGSLEDRLSLFIGNENDHKHTSVFLEDISQVQNKELVHKLEQLNKIVSETHTEIKRLAIEAYKSEPMIEGALDELEETKSVA